MISRRIVGKSVQEYMLDDNTGSGGISKDLLDQVFLIDFPKVSKMLNADIPGSHLSPLHSLVVPR